MTPKRISIVAGALALLAVLVVGLVQLAGSSTKPTARSKLTLAQMQARLSESPPALAALHAQASELLPGGLGAFRHRLTALRGRPIVINKWASWCIPCRSEFGAFQDAASSALGRRVAFLGIDSADTSRAAAAAFLRGFPVPLPELLRRERRARLGDHRLLVHARDRLLRRLRRAVHPPGAVPERREARTRHPALRARREGRLSVPEIRIDPLSGHRTIVAGERSRRPGGAPGLPASVRETPPIDPRSDPFAEGNEDRTPPELYAVRPGGGVPDSPGWTVRVVPNLFPALAAEDGAGGGSDAGAADAPAADLSAPLRGDARGELFSSMPARGAHEVIVNGPQPVLSLCELPVEQVAAAIDVWRERMRFHEQSAYVQLIVNERREAGASLPHTHSQLYALDFVPAAVARERERAGAYATRNMGQNLLGDLVAEEVRLRERVVAIDDDAVLIAPYASRLPFQLMLAPRRPRARFEQDGPTGAALLHDGLRRLARHLGASPPLNMWVRTAPRGAEHFCWRIDVVPRLTHLAGLELATDVNLNIVAPEHAASLLREA